MNKKPENPKKSLIDISKEMRLVLIVPKPRDMTQIEGEFFWDRESILLTDTENQEIRFAISLFFEECKKRNQVCPKLESDKQTNIKPAFIIGQRDRLPVTRGILNSISHPVPEYMGTEGYFLEITPERLVLLADTAAGVYYGVQTLLDILPETTRTSFPCAIIVDIPTVAIRGYMQDFGRGQTPMLETLKNTMVQMGRVKLNAFFPYFEDGFHFKSHPAIGKNRDRMEPEEARELTAFAQKHHIRIIPIHETIGHMEGILELPEYIHLREGDGPRERSILNLAHPEAIPLLEDTIQDLCDVFPDPLFFAATDECLFLGEHASKKEAELLGKGGLFTGHVKRLREILLKHNKRMILSPDPIEPGFFKAFGLEGFPREFLLRIPRDIIFTPWHYGRMDSHPFGEFLKEHGIDQILWGAADHCGRIFTNVQTNAENALTYMRFAHTQNALGGVVSQWDSNPGDSSFPECDWPLIAYFAECLWNPAPRELGEFLPNFFEGFYGTVLGRDISESYIILGNSDNYIGWGGEFMASAQHRQFYRPLEPHKLTQEQLEQLRELRKETEKMRQILEKVKGSARRNLNFLECLEFSVFQMKILTDLIKARHEMSENGRLSPERHKNLLADLESLKEMFRELWMRAYKPKALPLNLERFDKVTKSIQEQAL